jgi:hypothetical protein
MSSKSPQSRRGSSQQHEKFSQGSVQTTQNSRPEPENSYARKLADGLPGTDESVAGADAILKENR